ncbi:MAG: RNase H family protein [Gammaproteobacteria bacterium]
MNTLLIFTDAATSSSENISVGAFLLLEEKEFQKYIDFNLNDLFIQLENKIVYKKYNSKKSTWSEIQTAIDALNHTHLPSASIVKMYTDCQSLCDLLGKRKEKLLKNNFITRAGKVLQNADLYKELYQTAEKFQLSTLKIKGHQKVSDSTRLEEKIFSILDKFSRRKLRELLTLIDCNPIRTSS